MTDVVTSDAADVTTIPPAETEWARFNADADEVAGEDWLTGDASDLLINVPHVIYHVVYRDGTQRKGVAYRDDYVSLSVLTAPVDVMKKRIPRGLDPLNSAGPDEYLGYNDGSTGVYRQITEYLAAKGHITLPDGEAKGGKGESVYDLPRSQWLAGAEDATEGFDIRLRCPRGLRISEYDNEYTQDGKTRYIA
jgi:hypothetical protein